MIGQVHKAKIKSTGEIICLKVQYPGVGDAIDSDVDTIRRIFKVMKILPVDSSQFDEVLDEAKTMLKREVDYIQEMKMTDFYREAYKDNPKLKVPKTYPRYTTKKVIATEFCEGISLSDPKVKNSHRREEMVSARFYLIHTLKSSMSLN